MSKLYKIFELMVLVSLPFAVSNAIAEEPSLLIFDQKINIPSRQSEVINFNCEKKAISFSYSNDKNSENTHGHIEDTLLKINSVSLGNTVISKDQINIANKALLDFHGNPTLNGLYCRPDGFNIFFDGKYFIEDSGEYIPYSVSLYFSYTGKSASRHYFLENK